MEFVAGVSHELRTPVAVIKSAAENLSQGVVGSADRVKRYGTDDRRRGTPARRDGRTCASIRGDRIGARHGRPYPLAPDGNHPVRHRQLPAAARPGQRPDPSRHRSQSCPRSWATPPRCDRPCRTCRQRRQVRRPRSLGGCPRASTCGSVALARCASPSAITATASRGELPHIFEPFYRGADAVAQQIHGNGLGLSLVRRIVAHTADKVSATSRPGTGSAFTISLPAALGKPPAQPPPRSALRRSPDDNWSSVGTELRRTGLAPTHPSNYQVPTLRRTFYPPSCHDCSWSKMSRVWS